MIDVGRAMRLWRDAEEIAHSERDRARALRDAAATAQRSADAAEDEARKALGTLLVALEAKS